MKAYSRTQAGAGENVLGIRVSNRVPDEVKKAEELWSLLQANNLRAGIKLHSRVKEKP